MIQHCDFRRIDQTDEHQCGNCGKIVHCQSDNPLSRCNVEAPDPPERDPATLPCRWRGELLRTDKADTPGTKREAVSVFECTLAPTIPDSVSAGSSPAAAPKECCLESKLRTVQACMRCESREPGQLPRIGPPAPAPLRNGLPFAWEGECARKPWQYDVAAMIPVLDSVEALPLIIELLRLQTVRPYILLVDTGSSPENFAQVEALRADDVEVHALRLNGFEHSSQSVAMAIDAAMAVCQSRFLFLSHSDCFLRSRTVLEEFAELAQDHPVVGYQITPRPHQDWRGMVGHTATMLDMHEMHRHGLSWNLRRMCAAFGLTPKTHADRPGWPDTELGFYYACRDAGIEPLIVGQEENHVRTLDARIDHCRSVASMEFYSGSYARKAEWEDAMKSAAERVAAWQAEPVTATSREWRQRAFVPKPLPEFRREWTR